MTTHVFIVDENTFKYHLEYMFAGTGAADKDVDFNSSPMSKLHHSAESGLVLMMADGCRVRKNDLIIFYLLATAEHEGMFFGVFQAIDDGIFLDRNDASQFLKNELGKSLLFRLKIQPYEVYPKGVTEWSALDEIKNIGSPYQMLWSLIYRKLKGNRGNTMITIYEAERLISLLRNENNHNTLNCNGKCLTYDPSAKSIVDINKPIPAYSGRKEPIDIMPRLLSKYNDNKAFEAHLQMYITQNVGRGTDKSLDTALGISKTLWNGLATKYRVVSECSESMLCCRSLKTRQNVSLCRLNSRRFLPTKTILGSLQDMWIGSSNTICRTESASSSRC